MRSSFYLLFMHVGVEALALGRNIMLARLLGPSEMGRATLLAVTLRMLEMASDCATDRLLIQAPDGNRASLQAHAHGAEILRGLFSSLLMLVLCMPLTFLGDAFPPVAAFCGLALIPLMKGFVHLDFKRLQRNMNFRPAALVEMAASSAALLAVYPSAYCLADYRAVLVVAFLQGLTAVLASHLLAQRSYRIGFDPAPLARIWRFGWPLALNGLLMFLVFQGDRLLVAMACSPAELGRYAIAFQLSLIPVLILSRLGSSVFLPLLSRFQRQPERFLAGLQLGGYSAAVLSVWLALAIVMAQGDVIRFVYGPEFAVSQTLIICLGLMHAFRLLRSMPAIASVASGDSLQPLLVNIVRTSGVLAAAVCAILGHGLTAIAAAGCAGEFLALCASLVSLQLRQHVPLKLWLQPAAVVCSGLTVVSLLVVGPVLLPGPLPWSALVLILWASIQGIALLCCWQFLRQAWFLVKDGKGYPHRQAAQSPIAVHRSFRRSTCDQQHASSRPPVLFTPE